MLKKLIDLLVSVKVTLGIVLLLLVFILIGFYVPFGLDRTTSLFDTVYFNSLLLLLSISLSICTIKRTVKLIQRGSNVTSVDSRLGSIVFHIGMVIIMVGFGISSLFGMRGKVIIPEGVVVQFPKEVQLIKQGQFHKPDNYHIGLKSMELVREGETIGQVRGKLDFMQGYSTERQIVEINHPAKYEGYYWRSQEWGYTVKMRIINNEVVIFDDYVNIATHSDTLFYDKFELSNQVYLEIQFFPSMQAGGIPDREAIFPDNPGLMVKISNRDNEKMSGQGVVQKNVETTIGGYTVIFEDYNFWEQFDVSSDPGEIFIYFGGIACIAGLALRIFGRKE